MKKKTLYAILVGMLSALICNLYDITPSDLSFWLVTIPIIGVLNGIYSYCTDDVKAEVEDEIPPVTFKDVMEIDLIPRMEEMIEKEKRHLNYLIDKNAPQEMIDGSRAALSHLRVRHKEYVDYLDTL